MSVFDHVLLGHMASPVRYGEIGGMCHFEYSDSVGASVLNPWRECQRRKYVLRGASKTWCVRMC